MQMKNLPVLAGLRHFLTFLNQTNHCLTQQTRRALFLRNAHVFPQRCQGTIILVIFFSLLSPLRFFHVTSHIATFLVQAFHGFNTILEFPLRLLPLNVQLNISIFIFYNFMSIVK